MGFREGAWATIWSIEPSRTGRSTRVRLSVSRKNRDGEYEQDFSGFCTLIGDAHKKAQEFGLKEKDRIQIKQCDVSTSYDKTNNVEYTNYKIFNISQSQDSDSAGKNAQSEDDFEVGTDGDTNEDDLPF